MTAPSAFSSIFMTFQSPLFFLVNFFMSLFIFSAALRNNFSSNFKQVFHILQIIPIYGTDEQASATALFATSAALVAIYVLLKALNMIINARHSVIPTFITLITFSPRAFHIPPDMATASAAFCISTFAVTLCPTLTTRAKKQTRANRTMARKTKVWPPWSS